jgi:hypothetical protein
MVDVWSGTLVDFEIVQTVNTSRRGNYQGSGNGMEVEAQIRRENNEKMTVAVTDQD